MFNAQSLQEKWAPVLNHSGLDEISDSHRKAVTAVILENQEKFMREERGVLNEVAVNFAGASNMTGAAASTGAIAGFDPVLISLIRRAMPNLVAYDICGVQPMSGPTGLIFAMKAKYENQGGEEALYNEPDAGFSGGYDANQGDYAVRNQAWRSATWRVTTLQSSTIPLLALMSRLQDGTRKISSVWAKQIASSARWHSASRRPR